MLEENPYYDVKAISNSSLKKISSSEGGHPKKYKAFINGNEEKLNTLSLERGKLLHKWVENSDSFEVSEIEAPSEMGIIWVKEVLRLEELNKNIITTEEDLDSIFDKLILIAKDKLDIYNNIKKDFTIIEKFKKELLEYYTFLKYPSDKIALTKITKNILFNCYQSLYTNTRANNLLFTNLEVEGCTVFNELAIYFKINGIECKALLDRVIILNTSFEKIIQIVDLKTTSKPIGNYPNEFAYYRTYRQLAFYGTAIKEFLKQLDYNDIDDYEISYHIVAVETTGQFITEVFDVDQKWIDKGVEEYTRLLDLVKYHTLIDNWELSKNQITNNNVLVYDEFKYLKNQ